jgi:RimJ/RimL family protein N-acetyltransferase
MEIRDIQALVPDWEPPARPDGQPIEGRFARICKVDANVHSADLYRANTVAGGDRIWDYMPYGPFSSYTSYHRWLRDVAKTDDPYFYAITDLSSGHVCGIASFLNINPAMGSIELGHINLSLELQGKPAATEAFYLMIKWAFEAGYRRFEWKCNAANLKSRGAAERLGLSYEGVFRQHLVVKGRNRDTAWFAAIDSEWQSLKSAYEAWLSPSNFDTHGQQIESLRDITALVLTARDPINETR